MQLLSLGNAIYVTLPGPREWLSGNLNKWKTKITDICVKFRDYRKRLNKLVDRAGN